MLNIKRNRSSFSQGSNERSKTNSELKPQEEDKETKDKIYAEFLSKMEQSYYLVKHKTMCQKMLINDCKRCEICLSVDNKQDLVFCDLCEDAFHLNCLKEKNEKRGKNDKFYCPNCTKEHKDKLYSISNFENGMRKVGKHVMKVSS